MGNSIPKAPPLEIKQKAKKMDPFVVVQKPRNWSSVVRGDRPIFLYRREKIENDGNNNSDFISPLGNQSSGDVDENTVEESV